MPYKDKNKEKEYKQKWHQEHKEEIAIRNKKWRKNNREHYNAYSNRKWQELYAQRRAKYMANKSCPYCGEDDSSKLLLHHLFPKDITLKYGNSNIWKWSESRRIRELLKCLVVCRACHVKIHAKHRRIYG